MKTALAQINPTIGDFEGNVGKILTYIEKAKSYACDLVVFPELVIPGYPPKDLLEKREFVKANLNALDYVIKKVSGIGVVLGYIEINEKKTGNPIHNAAVLFENGHIIHKSVKRLLPTYDVFDERRYFEPGDDYSICFYKGKKIGVTICEDMWNDSEILPIPIYDEDPIRRLVENGADFLVNISASPFHCGKIAIREKLLFNITKKFRVPIVHVNQIGGNDSILFDGNSRALDKNGDICAKGVDFAEDMVIFDETIGPPTDLKPVSESETEAVMNALVMGVSDYMSKCGFKKTVVGLSGGIDSALTAAIAVKALGPENVKTIFMPSPYTSKDNFEDTEVLAQNLGVERLIIPIDPVFKTMLDTLGDRFGGERPGIAEQNMQARIRGTILMAHSNKDGSILLTTGNKSELAVGYCTLYGDMNGGLAVISDVPKGMVYDISRFINKDGEVIPERVINKAPSAELAPDQKDEDDLPPYPVLDEILKAYVEEAKSVNEIVAMGFDRDMVRDVIRRISINEYKRQQAALGLKVTGKAFGYGRRYPIAQRFNPGCRFL